MTTKIRLLREVTTEQCPWLEENLSEGTEFYTFEGYTYGCIGPTGRAVSFAPNENPFFEIPSDSFEVVDD